MPTPRTEPSERQNLMRCALRELAGAALVLDDKLRIVDWAPGTEKVVGSPLRRGVAAPALLCGHGEERPVAEALAAGRSVVAEVVRPAPEGSNRVVHVRTTPLEEDGRRVGWLLLLSAEAQDADAPDAPIERWGILTRDPAMKRLLKDVEKVAATDASVLVRGETGSGKELVAHAIHSASPRRTGPFRTINCAALPASLLESELFGHVRGAFTGAVRDAPGHFRLAHRGTLFLDEIGELPLDLQAKLLRVLADRTVIPVGGTDPVEVDVRVIAATHRSLRRAVEEGRFRDDLMYRLRVVPLFLPALRERPADVPLLAWHFVTRHNERGGRHVTRIAPAAVDAMQRHDWPGNVRELENAIEYAFVMGEGPVLTEAELPPEVRGHVEEVPAAARRTNRPPSTDGRNVLPPEALRIRNALERAGGHRGRAAAILGISRTTLWRKMQKHGLV
ncbi:MAG: sigma-54 interaction domain-containing protein [Myxococcota bacterium]